MIKIIIFFKDQATTHRKAQETLHRGTSTTEARRSSRKEPAQESTGAQHREPSNYLFLLKLFNMNFNYF
jgi:hypothetical protein